jgi:ribosome modulation factor
MTLTPFSLEQLEEYWAEGYQAFVAGDSQRSHPKHLRHGSPALKAWLQGWEKARSEFTDLPPEEH